MKVFYVIAFQGPMRTSVVRYYCGRGLWSRDIEAARKYKTEAVAKAFARPAGSLARLIAPEACVYIDSVLKGGRR
jgi:hypothetical protein